MGHTVFELAPAKINLILHVTGQRRDGYHLLDSLVVFAPDAADRLTLTPAKETRLTVRGPFAGAVPPGAENLVLRAAHLAGVGAHIELTKNLPVMGGIGGGSADAAACLRGLARVADRPLCDGLSLGADVPVCVAGRPARMAGIGDIVTPLDTWPNLAAVLLNPGVSLSTPTVFKALKKRQNSPPNWRALNYNDPLPWLKAGRNDLEEPARRLALPVRHALDALRDAGADLVRMSGSGSTCVGLFSDMPAARAAETQLARPGWWVRATRLTGTNPP